MQNRTELVHNPIFQIDQILFLMEWWASSLIGKSGAIIYWICLSKNTSKKKKKKEEYSLLWTGIRNDEVVAEMNVN